MYKAELMRTFLRTLCQLTNGVVSPLFRCIRICLRIILLDGIILENHSILGQDGQSTVFYHATVYLISMSQILFMSQIFIFRRSHTDILLEHAVKGVARNKARACCNLRDLHLGFAQQVLGLLDAIGI